MESYKGFKVVKMKFSSLSSETSEIYWKPHSVREYNMKKPGGRTLYIINLPSYITKESLENMMKMFGKVSNVFFHKKPNANAPPDVIYPLLGPEQLPEGYKVAYVVFGSSKSLEKAMSMSSKKILIASTGTQPIVTGLNKWLKEYNDEFLPFNTLKNEVEAIMKDYDDRKAKEKEGLNNDPDEDGWITVSNKNNKRPASEGRSRSSAGKRKRRKKTQLTTNFYAFQVKEANMKHLEEKRQKFEEDGRRMALLRSSRKFKPL